MATLQFLGAAGTVTGSMHLLRVGEQGVLLDCGLFQGEKALRQRNWGQRIDPKEVDAVVLSHAHIDHTGYLPVLARRGYRGPIHCTSGTADLVRVLLADSARLLEEEAERANYFGYSKHKPALPLYTAGDAERVLELLEPQRYGRPFGPAKGVEVLYRPAGHILGAATLDVRVDGAGTRRLAFSGDLGRWDRPIIHDPQPIPEADVLLLESTYGNRAHPAGAEEQLARIVNDAAARGGALLVPAFAVGRTQELIWMLRQLEKQQRIPTLPIWVDSPMATEVSYIYARHPEDHDVEMAASVQRKSSPLDSGRVQISRTREDSRKLNQLRGPVIIIAGSGMATGGRILHHLLVRLDDPRTTVLLVGFQSVGSRGRALRDGVEKLRLFGRELPVRATVESLDALSAHADREELLRWLSGFTRPPSRTYLVHGEPAAAQSLAEAIRERYRWDVAVARDRQTVEL
ncbi:MAG: MBL fold metallo-hydrolase [Gemmatimonadetes bacterium]|nr:MBL fold metallo-hydrolase [Gemmatimonadota bacterium]